MAIVAYDGKRVEMLSTWSQSVASLTQVLEKAKERKAYGLERQDETRTFDSARAIIERDEALLSEGLAGGQVTAGDESFDRLGIDERHQIAVITDQVKRAVLAASTALRSFAGPPGRRVFMLASGGWPNSPAVWMAGDQTSASFEDEYPWGEGLYGPLIETANRLRARVTECGQPDTTIKMRKRKHDVVVTLYDQLSGKIISTKMEVDPRDVDPRQGRDQGK